MEKIRTPVKIDYADNRTRLRITLDLTQTWEVVQSKRRFRRPNTQVPFFGNIRFRCDVWLSLASSRFGEFGRELPLASFGECAAGHWRFSLNETLLAITIPTSEEFWKPQEQTKKGWFKSSYEGNFNFHGLSQRPAIFSSHRTSIPDLIRLARERGPDIWMSITVFRLGDPAMRHPVGREEFENKLVISGGRPESNRRKF